MDDDAPPPGDGGLHVWVTSFGVGAALGGLRAYLAPTPHAATVEDTLPRVEEVQLKKLLDTVLIQVQTAVREMNMEPVKVTDLISSRRTDAGPIYPISRRDESGPCYPSCRRVDGISGYLKSFMQGFRNFRPEPASATVLKNEEVTMFRNFRSQPASKPDAEVSKNEEVTKKLVSTIAEFTTSMKAFVAAKVANGTMTDEFAEELFVRIDCLSQNVQMTVKSSSHCFSLSGLRNMLKMPVGVSTFVSSLTMCARLLQKVSTIAECIVDNIGTTPGQYSSIGKETLSILTDDFSLKRLKLNSAPFEQMSFSLGGEYCGVTSEQFLMKLRGQDMSFLLCMKSTNDAPTNPVNATVPNVEADFFSAKLAFDKCDGKNLTCVIECPYPSFHGKIEMETTKPYWAYACDMGLPTNPKVNMSFLLGVKAAGVGALYTYDYKKGEGDFGFGMRTRTSLADFGITYKRPGIYKATFVKKILDSTTTVAAVASYSHVTGEEHGLTLGLKHAVDPSSHIKARVGSSGVSIALKKTFCSENCKVDVKAACNVDVKDPWRCPKFGLSFSYRA